METTIGILSLGCSKNLTDSEVMLGLLRAKGYRLAPDVTHCDVAIVNTCAFIEDAKQESIDRVLKLAELKRQGRLRGLVVTGCLAQKYYQALQQEIQQIDAFLGTGEYAHIAEVIHDLLLGKRTTRVEDTRFVYDHSTPRHSLTQRFSRYVKVGEGCNHRCSFCIIPELRGDYRSRPISSIVEEVRRLVDEGMREVNLISQDTSFYGYDVDQKHHLSELLEALQGVERLKWIRLLYNHPVHVTDDTIEAIARYSKVCKYIDMPLQHINDSILKSMKRGITKEKTVRLIEKIRDRIPGVAIRTTFIVGYPGEGQEQFEELMKFVGAMRFDRVGAFTYSRGDDKASSFEGQVSEKEKRRRKDLLMHHQQEISQSKNREWLHRNLEILIERPEQKPYLAVGRSYRDAPEIDGQVYIRSSSNGRPQPGSFYQVKIVDTLEYDLIADADSSLSSE
jgi:ribosomal protein S12 methylthiotransferase